MKIAICGKMCSGKTTLAQSIQRMDPRYTRYSIGQHVKEIGIDLFHMTTKDRSLLIAIGAKMREIDPDVWIKYILEQTKDKEHCLIDDMRYQNEYDLLQQHGFVFIQLHIPRPLQEQRIKQLYTTQAPEHLDNRDHLSEKNDFQWIVGSEPKIHIYNTEHPDTITQHIHSFLQKNENGYYS
jgi:hypothetical protein